MTSSLLCYVPKLNLFPILVASVYRDPLKLRNFYSFVVSLTLQRCPLAQVVVKQNFKDQ